MSAAITLAEMVAIAAIKAPAKLAGLQPLLAFMPLLAQRRGVSVDAVYAMPATEAIEAGIDAVIDTLSDDAITATYDALKHAWGALDPDRLRQRVTP